jgi:hypothetical protein
MEHKVKIKFRRGEGEQTVTVTVAAELPQIARVAALLAFRHLEGDTSHVIESEVIS